MRLIISPLAPPPGPSLFVRPSIHPSRGQKASKSSQFFSLSLCLHSKQSSEKINMHRECSAIVKTASVPGTDGFTRSIIRPIDSEARTDRGPAASPRSGFTSSWILRGRSCSSGLLVPPFCQYRQPKLNKDVY